LGNSEVGANPGDTRIARVPGDVEEIARIDESRESAGADDLHAVREDLDADVVPGHRVGAVQNSVDEPLEPRVTGHDRLRLETTAYGEGPTAWQETFDGFGCRRNLAGEGSFAADVRSVVKGESRAGTALAFRVAQDTHVRVGEQALGMFGEQQVASDSQLAEGGEQVPSLQHAPGVR